ncbi:MAG TPA: type II CAAX endopeptidase family protein [Candidatus Deferrimicrobiaceae bacterium]
MSGDRLGLRELIISFFVLVFSFAIFHFLYRLGLEILNLYVPKVLKEYYLLAGSLALSIVYLSSNKIIKPEEYGFTKEKKLKMLLYGLAGGLLLSFLNLPLGAIIRGGEWGKPTGFIGLDNKQIFYIPYILLICIIFPIIEEVFYRGYAFNIIKNRYGFLVSIAVVSLCYGLIHLSPAAIIYSVALTIIYEHSGCLGASIVSHAVMNITFYITNSVFG